MLSFVSQYIKKIYEYRLYPERGGGEVWIDMYNVRGISKKEKEEGK